MPELIGQTLNRYLILSLLGEGGMGSVYKAQDTALKRDVAVKVLHSHFAAQPNFRERFLQEARTAARLDHPGIVKVFDFGEAQSQLYIVMELISGGNLQDVINKEWGSGRDPDGQGFSPELSTKIIRQIALTLDYLHKQGILHRDIKPANILLKPEPAEGLPYRLVLSDLGLARLLDSPKLTQDGSFMGTPAYMSPEQASGLSPDARSDVYSLGILFYELAVGRLPFPINTITEAIRYHIKEPPPAPRSLRPELPESLELLILRAMEKDPAMRFPDAAALAQALEQGAGGHAGGVGHAGPPLQPRQPVSRAIPPAKSAGPIPPSRFAPPGQRQPSPKSDRNASIPPNVDHIQVTVKNKPPQYIPIKPRVKDMVEMSIGRDEDADISLDSPGVSRQHAKLTYDGNEYYLTDLNSTNRTFLGDAELLPGVAERWNPEKVAQIGVFVLQLVLAGKKAQPVKLPSKPPAERQGFRRTNGSLIPLDPGNTQMESRIWVDLEEDTLTVEAGNKVSMNVNLLNQGGFVDQFHISVKGVDETWVSVPPAVNLMPGSQATVIITFQPPRQPSSQAKKYDLTIRVTPEKPPKKVSTAPATLTILPFFKSRSDLHPEKIRGRQVTRVTIQNMGNSPENFVLTPSDKGDELVFRPPQAMNTIPEGQQAAVEFRARPLAPRLFGNKQSHQFKIQVRSSQGDLPPHTGEYVSKALIPPWLPITLMVLCALLIFSFSKLKTILTPKSTPTIEAILALEPTLTPTYPVVSSFDTTSTPTTISPTANVTQTAIASCSGVPEAIMQIGDFGKISGEITQPLLRVRKTSVVMGNKAYVCMIYANENTEFEIKEGPQCVLCQTDCIETAEKPFPVRMWKIYIYNADKRFKDSCDNGMEGWIVEGDPENAYIQKIDK